MEDRMRRIALCLFALAALGTGAGCGEEDTGPPLSSDEFVKQANAICKEGDTKLAEEGKELLKDPNTAADVLTKFYLDHAVPNARTKLERIGELNPPAKDKDKVKKMLAAGKKATDTVEDGLEEQGTAFRQAQGPDLFKEFDDMAKDLKLTDCAGQS
jgi:hypothetical protein